jgi:hypothetical protein
MGTKKNYSPKRIKKIQTVEENYLIDWIKLSKNLPPDIAVNRPFRENILSLFICIYSKTPLFICGKPGSSKTISVNIIKNTFVKKMQPDTIEKKKLEFFNGFKTIRQFYYQGSQQSTDVGIERVFKNAKKNKNKEQVSLVFFDEIGLAELSPQNPLKVLHKYLDYSTDDKEQENRMKNFISKIEKENPDEKEEEQDADKNNNEKEIKKEESQERDIAFVGISNWTIDVSKMNRNVYLSRPSPSQDDLYDTALAILKYQINKTDSKEIFIENYLPKLARTVSESYYQFWMSQEKYSHKNFHSLRDFYWLLKYLGTQIVEKLKGDLYSNKKEFWDMNYFGIDKNFSGIFYVEDTFKSGKHEIHSNMGNKKLFLSFFIF